jgi:4a-hydroxytetrahydrobiopterin dehydratase
MSHPFAGKHCQAFKKGDAGLKIHDIKTYLAELSNGWQYNEKQGLIERDFTFQNYYETLAFVNALALVAHHENHHPDLSVHYNHCLVQYSTHDVGGISINDFICAHQADMLYELAK